MPKKPDDDTFHDCEFGPDVVLGARTFHDGLFIDDIKTPVNMLIGETPTHSQAIIKEPNLLRFFEQYETVSAVETQEPHQWFNEALPQLVDGIIETVQFETENIKST